MRKFLDWLYWDFFRWFFILISCVFPIAIVMEKRIIAVVLGMVCVLYYLFLKWYVKNIWKKG